MQVFYILILFVNITGITQTTKVVPNNKPVKITIITKEGNRFQGLLLEITDSTIVLFPGKRKDWKKQTYRHNAIFHYQRISSIGFLGEKKIVNGDIEQFIAFASSYIKILSSK